MPPAPPAPARGAARWRSRGKPVPALLLFLPLALLVLGSSGLAFVALTEPEQIRLETQLLNQQRHLQRHTLESLGAVLSDLRYLTGLYSAWIPDEHADPRPPELLEAFRLFSLRRGLYDQIRFIDRDGREVIRVNYDRGDPRVVPETELQTKSHRYYVSAALALAPGEIYHSPLDLNIEHQRIERPLKPMVRFATPVADRRGHVRGIFVLNYDGARLLAALDPDERVMPGEQMLLNPEGYWLKGPDPGKTWGFMFPERAGDTLGREDPEAWRQISDADSGQFYDERGLYTFTTIHLDALPSLTGASPAPGIRAERYWKLVNRVPQAQLVAQQRRVLHWILPLDAGALLLGALGTTALVRARRRRHRAETRLAGQERLAEVTLESIGDGVITTDTEGRVRRMNPAAERLTGWSQAQALGAPLAEVFPIVGAADRRPLPDPMQRAMAEGRAVSLGGDTLLMRADGQERTVMDSAAPIRDGHGQVVGGVLVFHDVTDQRQLSARLAWEATHDAVTGLANRREFERHLLRALSGVGEGGREHTLIYLDLDQFKVVNDTYGHAVGDRLLQALSDALHAQLPEPAVLARLGGDEFGVLLENCPLSTGIDAAQELLRRIRDFRFHWQGEEVQLSASLGVVPVTGADGEIETLLGCADIACYSAKERGRNRVHVYHPDDARLVRRHSEMAWVSRIRRALAEDRLCLFAQPIVPVASPEAPPRRYEILLRLEEPEGRIATAGEFVAAAERYDLMPLLDRWVVERALAWCFAQQQAGNPGLSLAVNLSGGTLASQEFMEFMREVYGRYPVAAGSICLEITETAAISNLNQAVRFIHQMGQLGFRFALDDFGSGLSSFAYLKNLPVAYLKIDGAFITSLGIDPLAESLVEAFQRIAYAAGVQTVAEFVETDAQLRILRRLGVDYAQGYAIGEPVPLAAVDPVPQRGAEARGADTHRQPRA